MSRRHWQTVIIVVIVLIVGGIVGLSLTGRPIVWQPPTAEPARPPKGSGPRTELPPSPGIDLQGQVQAPQTHQITAPVSGAIVALIAPEGQPVVAGQQLLQMDVPGLRQQLTAAHKRLQQLQALEEKGRDPELRDKLDAAEKRAQGMVTRLKQMQEELAQYGAEHPTAGAVLDTYRVAQAEAAAAAMDLANLTAQVSKAQQQAARAGKQPPSLNELMQRLQRAQQRNSEAQARFEQAREAHSRARQEVNRLNILRDRVSSGQNLVRTTQREVAQLHQNPAVAMITEGRARLKRSGAEVARLEQQVARLSIKAPANGILSELKARPGQRVQAGQALATLEGTGGPRLVFQASKQQAQRLAVGMRAKVTVPNSKGFDATIGQIVTEDSRAQIYLVPLKQAQLPAPGTALQARL